MEWNGINGERERQEKKHRIKKREKVNKTELKECN
jgi:hypothetical protein